jgi:hypothetical protein
VDKWAVSEDSLIKRVFLKDVADHK